MKPVSRDDVDSTILPRSEVKQQAPKCEKSPAAKGPGSIIAQHGTNLTA